MAEVQEGTGPRARRDIPDALATKSAVLASGRRLDAAQREVEGFRGGYARPAAGGATRASRLRLLGQDADAVEVVTDRRWTENGHTQEIDRYGQASPSAPAKLVGSGESSCETGPVPESRCLADSRSAPQRPRELERTAVVTPRPNPKRRYRATDIGLSRPAGFERVSGGGGIGTSAIPVVVPHRGRHQRDPGQ